MPGRYGLKRGSDSCRRAPAVTLTQVRLWPEAPVRDTAAIQPLSGVVRTCLPRGDSTQTPSRPGEFHPEPLTGRVEAWRAGLGRSLFSLFLALSFASVTLSRPATFPVPATSNAACGFPALRSPVCFTSRVMRPIVLEQLSALATEPCSYCTAAEIRTAIAYSTASSRSPCVWAPHPVNLFFGKFAVLFHHLRRFGFQNWVGEVAHPLGFDGHARKVPHRPRTAQRRFALERRNPGSTLNLDFAVA
jgi:hypothetical protein